MRIVAWNIRAGGGARRERIAAQLAEWAPEVAVLSEFRATPPSCEIAAALAAMGLRHQRTTATPERRRINALLVASRWPLRRLPTRFAADERERWMALRVEAPGRPFVLGALHIPCSATGRKNAFHDAVLEVARRWRGRRALLIGDTNSGEPGLDEQAPVFGTREQHFFDALGADGWGDAFRRIRGRERVYTWYSPNRGNGFRLDQGFLSASFLPALAGARYAWGGSRRDAPSDHAALLLDFERQSRPAQVPPMPSP